MARRAHPLPLLFLLSLHRGHPPLHRMQTSTSVPECTPLPPPASPLPIGQHPADGDPLSQPNPTRPIYAHHPCGRPLRSKPSLHPSTRCSSATCNGMPRTPLACPCQPSCTTATSAGHGQPGPVGRARPDPKKPDPARPGCAIGPGSGRYFGPDGRAGPGSGLRKT